jgi:hypothetical protein
MRSGTGPPPVASTGKAILPHWVRAPLFPALSAAVLAMCLLGLRAWNIDYDYSIDFQAYWLAGQRVATGQAGDLYAAGGGPDAGTPQAMVAQEFKNIPLVAAAFAPLARLPYPDAKRVFWWINLAAVMATALVLGWGVMPAGWGPPLQRSLICLAALAVMAPTHIALRHAQTTPLITLLLALALAASLRKREGDAGLLLGLAFLIKWPAALIAASDFVRGRIRGAMVFAATVAGALVLSILIFGLPLHAAYLDGVTANIGTVMTGHNNQSVAAVITRLGGQAEVRDWTPQGMTTTARVLTAVVSLCLVAGVVLTLRRTAGQAQAARTRRLEFAALTTLGIIILPVAWDHYFMMMVPGLVALAVVLSQDRQLGRPPIFLLLAGSLAALALPSPGSLLDHAEALGPLGGLLLSHYFIGALGILALLYLAARPSSHQPGAGTIIHPGMEP